MRRAAGRGACGPSRAIHLPSQPLDILAQQIVAEVGAREWRVDDLFALVRRAAPYTELSRITFDEVLTLVADGVETGRGPRGRYVYHDAVNGEVRGRKGARLAALTSGGAIPEIGDYRVVAEPDDTFIGTVNEDWAVESMAGDIFLLGTHSWQIRRIEAGVVRVRDAGDAPPTVPFWTGEAPARTTELSESVSDLRAHVDGYLVDGQPDRARAWLVEATGIDIVAATMLVDYIAVGRAVLGATPTLQTIVVERFFDETGGMQLVIHSPYGGRINRALGLALRKKFCRTFNFELQAAASDDAIVLSLGPHHSFPLDEVARYVHSNSVEETLQQAVLDAPMFLSRWRWNLNRALLVLRFRGGRRNPPPIQRMEADDFMAALFPQAAACQENVVGPIEIPDHVIVRQTIYDTLHEALDVDGVRALLVAIESGAVAVHTVDTTEPSVLAHEILTARPYAFLDDEELQNRRTNAVTLRRGLSVDLASIGQLDPEAIARVEEETTPRPTTADDLHDLLCSLVLTSPGRNGRTSGTSSLQRGGCRSSNTTMARWCATEMVADAARIGRRRRGDHHGGVRPPRSRRNHHCGSPGGDVRARAEPRHVRAGRPRTTGQGAPRFVHGRRDRRRVGGPPVARTHARVLTPDPSQANRTRDGAGSDALPAPVAASRAGHAARRRCRARDDHRPAPGMGGGGRGLGTGAAREADAQARSRGSRSPVPRRRGRLAPPRAARARRRSADRRRQQGHADRGAVSRRHALVARSGAQRSRARRAADRRDGRDRRDPAGEGRVLRHRVGRGDEPPS